MYFLLIILSLFFPSFSFAQSPTVDPVKVETVRKMTEIMSKEQQGDSKNTTNSTTIPKSLIGTITQIGDSQITISYKNENKNITIINDTVFINEKQIKTKFNSLKSGQVILAMGYYDQFNNFTAKRIVITTPDEIENKNEIVFGTIADISQTSNILVLIPLKNKNTQYQIKTDSQTKIINKDNTVLTFAKLKSGQKVIIVIQPDTKISNTFDASQIITIDSASTSPTPTPKK